LIELAAQDRGLWDRGAIEQGVARAHLLEMAGDHAGAAVAYTRAARLTTGLPEQRYLQHRAAQAREAPATEDPPAQRP
jgi:predicted RNA polymerase sigma factor